jgi:hypothetical protein
MAPNIIEHYSSGAYNNTSPPRTPQCRTESSRGKNQSVMGIARSMLKAMSMQSLFWREAVNMAVFILNQSPTQSVKGRTPYDVCHGVKHSVHYLHTFCCVVKQGSKWLGKLDD